MFLIPGTERTKRRYAENVRNQFIAFDQVIFRDRVDIAATEAYRVIRLAPRKYAVAIDDPSLR